jgi:hypothetical protein
MIQEKILPTHAAGGMGHVPTLRGDSSRLWLFMDRVYY